MTYEMQEIQAFDREFTLTLGTPIYANAPGLNSVENVCVRATLRSSEGDISYTGTIRLSVSALSTKAHLKAQNTLGEIPSKKVYEIIVSSLRFRDTDHLGQEGYVVIAEKTFCYWDGEKLANQENFERSRMGTPHPWVQALISLVA